MSYRCSLPSPLQKRSKDYKGLHWRQNPEELSAPYEPILIEDLRRPPWPKKDDLKPEREYHEVRWEPEEIFEEHGFMWDSKPKKVLRWVLVPMQSFVILGSLLQWRWQWASIGHFVFLFQLWSLFSFFLKISLLEMLFNPPLTSHDIPLTSYDLLWFFNFGPLSSFFFFFP